MNKEDVVTIGYLGIFFRWCKNIFFACLEWFLDALIEADGGGSRSGKVVHFILKWTLRLLAVLFAIGIIGSCCYCMGKVIEKQERQPIHLQNTTSQETYIRMNFITNVVPRLERIEEALKRIEKAMEGTR